MSTILDSIPADDIIAKALSLLESRAKYSVDVMSSPHEVRDYLRLKIGAIEHEEFYCVWLDARNGVIAFEKMFNGSLTATAVFPREIVKRALQLNACSVIVAHNHPSGNSEPSTADEKLTRQLVDALGLVDVKVLDHLVVTARGIVSFAERGLI